MRFTDLFRRGVTIGYRFMQIRVADARPLVNLKRVFRLAHGAESGQAQTDRGGK